MLLFKNKENCCGCTACINICRKDAISIKTDEEGFLYPIIDVNSCVECGLCQTVCPIKNELNLEKLTDTEGEIAPYVYAVKHKDDEVRMASSSGGAYTAISDYILAISDDFENNKINGLCYGAAFRSDFRVQHKVAENATERDEFRGSKYVQSDLKKIFSKIEKNLIQKRTVLFTGTPCQTAGLAKFLELSRVDMTNLILNDIICHGTPSPKLWNEYLKKIENKYGSKLKSFTFRDKKYGWRSYAVKAEFDNGIIKANTAELRIFTKIFFSHAGLRPSCYKCKYTNTNRPSDITLGDFWGLEKCLPDFEDEKGVSLILINTQKGKDIFDKIKKNLCTEPSNISDCKKYQCNLLKPTESPRNRKEFWQDYYNYGFNYIAKKYAGYGFIGKIKYCVVKILRNIGLENIIKKVLRQ